MYVLGLTTYHDSAAVLLRDGKVIYLSAVPTGSYIGIYDSPNNATRMEPDTRTSINIVIPLDY